MKPGTEVIFAGGINGVFVKKAEGKFIMIEIAKGELLSLLPDSATHIITDEKKTHKELPHTAQNQAEKNKEVTNNWSSSNKNRDQQNNPHNNVRTAEKKKNTKEKGEQVKTEQNSG